MCARQRPEIPVHRVTLSVSALYRSRAPAHPGLATGDTVPILGGGGDEDDRPEKGRFGISEHFRPDISGRQCRDAWTIAWRAGLFARGRTHSTALWAIPWLALWPAVVCCIISGGLRSNLIKQCSTMWAAGLPSRTIQGCFFSWHWALFAIDKLDVARSEMRT